MRAELGAAAGWGHAEELLALSAELQHAGLRSQAGKKASSIKPLRIPRPYERRERRRPSSAAEMVAFLAKTTRR